MRLSSLSIMLAPVTFGACLVSDDATNGDGADAASPVDVGFRDGSMMAMVDASATDGGGGDTGEQTGCVYPDFVTPMALEEPIAPWSWPKAIDGAGVTRSLSVRDVFCNTDDDMDWSPFDLLLFIGIPAW